jgi:hypothetical protein
VGNTEACVGVVNSNETCVDEPAPRTGYKCTCNDGYGWDGKACTACMSRVAGTGYEGYNGDGIPATSAMLRLPHSVSVDEEGNIYIAGEPRG